MEDLITENIEFEYSLPGNRTNKMTVRELVDIIKPQVDLQLGEILKNFNQKGIRPSEFVGGFILTGGGSLLKGMPEAFSKYFQAFWVMAYLWAARLRKNPKIRLRKF